MQVVKAPNKHKPSFSTKVFLAGSIEMGKAENWQEKITEALSDLDIIIYNPRRDDWDSSWSQDPQKSSNFIEQVNWELDRIDQSDLVVFYFDGATISPITLLELGLCLGKKKEILVFCPNEYFRYGNVYLTMKQNGALYYLMNDDSPDYFEKFVREIKANLKYMIEHNKMAKIESMIQNLDSENLESKKQILINMLAKQILINMLAEDKTYHV